MFRFLPLLTLAVAATGQPPLSNLQTLSWQVQAQARERALSRRAETQFNKAPKPQPQTAPRSPSLRKNSP